MLGRICLVGALPLLLLATPVAAATKEEKMETCKVGAESQNLTGAKRDAFVKRCMAGGNYEPAARKEHLKKPKAAAGKKPAAAPAPAEEPAEKE